MLPLYENIKKRRIELNMSQEDLSQKLGYKSRSTIAKIEAGINDITQSKIVAFANALNTTVGYLMGDESENNFQSPSISEDYTTFPIIGDVAAGYNHIANEDWTGDTIDVPNSYLNGRQMSDFFVLSVMGDSMYPLYHSGDKVLILKQSTLEFSGDIGVILYDDEFATLKKIEYVKGEDWLKLIPINPNYMPEMIEGERLEHCKILGVPRLLIREIN